MSAKKPYSTGKADGLKPEITTNLNRRFKAALIDRWFLLIALLSFCAMPLLVAQVQPSNASEHTQCTYPDVTIEYGSMQKNGRKIFGGLVPYSRLWETGYNRSPTFITAANLMMGGKEVPAGRYSLFTIPNPDKWTLVIKKMTGKGNPNVMGEVARIDLPVKRLSSLSGLWVQVSRDGRGGRCLYLAPG